MTEGIFPKTDGSILYASEANDFYDTGRILQIYTGTGFNTSASSNTNNDEVELDDMTGITNGTYLKIEVTAYCSSAASSGPSSNTLQIQTKDIGGSYSDSYAETTIWAMTPEHASEAHAAMLTIIHIHTLTADEKTSGVKIKMLGQSTSVGSGITALTNKSTLVTLIA